LTTITGQWALRTISGRNTDALLREIPWWRGVGGAGSDPAPTSYFGRNNFGRTSGLNRHRVLVRKGSASGEIVSERIHSSLKNLEPRRPATLDTVRHRLFGQKRGQIQAGVLMNGHRIPAQQQDPVAPVPECYAELAPRPLEDPLAVVLVQVDPEFSVAAGGQVVPPD